MSDQSDAFIFYDNLSQLSQGNEFVARVPRGITTRDQLFAVLVRELNMPSYFGWNWDALEDFLRNLSWIACHRVIIAHEAVPGLESATLQTYLEVLAECVKHWRADEQHQLLVVFPEHAQAEIRTVQKGRNSP
jgi:RNAse (barnase) inhibitor barstar